MPRATSITRRKAEPKRKTARKTVAKTKAGAKGGEESALPLTAYRLNNGALPIVTGQTGREWMEQTPSRFAYRCMPMLLANQAGWMILSGHDISVIWDGRQGKEGLKIKFLSGEAPFPAVSIFGSGIVTFTLPYLFRTPPGYNLLVQGPANWPKDGVCALSGIVETDWAEATFTMNWKLTRPHHAVTFEKGEPICMVMPVKRYELERFQPEIRPLRSDPALHADYAKWAESRRQFNQDLKKEGSPARKAGWQKHYAQGRTVSEKRSEAHQSKLSLREFIDVSPPAPKK